VYEKTAIPFSGVSAYYSTEAYYEDYATTTSSTADATNQGISGCRHKFILSGCPANLRLPGYCGEYQNVMTSLVTSEVSSSSSDASGSHPRFCAGRFVYSNLADPSYVYFFSPQLGAIR